MYKKLIVILVGLLPFVGNAQLSKQWFVDKGIANHLDVGVSLGTIGFGLDLSVPVTDYARVRAGFDYMPRLTVPMTFDVGMYQEIPADVVDKQEYINGRFKQVSDLMYKVTGIQLDRKVQMNTHGRLFDFKFLVDIYPWKQNRHWHFTAGFYYGSDRVAHTENTAGAMPLLLSLKLYNTMYDFVMQTDFIDEPIYKDIYLDPDIADMLKDKVQDYGRIGVVVGKQGKKDFLIEPDANGMVSADLRVNHFKPYVGVGYTGNLTKDGRWKLGFDAGVLFWGKPRLISHQQTIIDGETHLPVMRPGADGKDEVVTGHYDLINDIDMMYGKVGTYVDIASTLKVYPVLNFKISFNIF